MDECQMANHIINTITTNYKAQIDKESIDVIQLINICKISAKNNTPKKNIKLSDIQFSPPDFPRTTKETAVGIGSTDFKKKYNFLIRLIYSCLKLKIELFDIVNNVGVFKNNHKLIKTLDKTKKDIIQEHIDFLTDSKRNVKGDFINTYEQVSHDFCVKIKLIDRIMSLLNELVRLKILDNHDNLYSLIMPFFYSKYIEEYN